MEIQNTNHIPQKVERGQALILIVFAIIALVGATALAIDGGNAYSERRKAQNAADTAALAGALARINNQSWVQTTYAVAAQNGYNNDLTTNTVQVYSPPISGPYKGDIEYVQVIITVHTKTYFAPVVGMPQITNVVEAVSRTKMPVYEPMVSGAAVVSLAPASDCENHRSFWIQGEATLSIIGGDVFINSNNPTCALIENGSGSIRINDKDHKIAIVGGATIQKPKLFTPYPPVTGAPPIPYPPPFFMPTVGCGNTMAEVTEDGHTISPGNWDDDFPPPGVNTMESGIYCLNKDFIVDGQKLTGANVLIKMEHGKLRFSGNAQINLSAKNGAGELAGLLIYQPADNKNPMNLNGNEESTFRGSILAPGAQIRINGNDSKSGFHSQIIGYTIYVNGQSNVIINILPDQNYNALSMPKIQFSK